jgi:hypothetical protein
MICSFFAKRKIQPLRDSALARKSPAFWARSAHPRRSPVLREITHNARTRVRTLTPHQPTPERSPHRAPKPRTAARAGCVVFWGARREPRQKMRGVGYSKGKSATPHTPGGGRWACRGHRKNRSSQRRVNTRAFNLRAHASRVISRDTGDRSAFLFLGQNAGDFRASVNHTVIVWFFTFDEKKTDHFATIIASLTRFPLHARCYSSFHAENRRLGTYFSRVVFASVKGTQKIEI